MTCLKRDFSVGVDIVMRTSAKHQFCFLSSRASYVDASPIVSTLNGLHDLHCETKAPPRDFFNLYPRSLPPPPENGDKMLPAL